MRKCLDCAAPAVPKKSRCGRCAARRNRLQRKAKLPPRYCIVCGEVIPLTKRSNAKVCSADCRSYQSSVEACKEGTRRDPTEVFPPSKREEAKRFLRTVKERGYRRMGRKTAGTKVKPGTAYYCPWRHGSLFVIRWFDPALNDLEDAA